MKSALRERLASLELHHQQGHDPAKWERVPEHRFIACLKRIQFRDELVGRGSQVVHLAEEILAGLREPGYS